MSDKVYAVLLAGGSGSRINRDHRKQFIQLAGKSILEHSIEAFEKNSLIDEIIIVINAGNVRQTEKLVDDNKYKKVIKVTEGGDTRQKSSFNGLSVIDNDDSLVLIHDAARPLVSQSIINECVDRLESYDAVVPVIKMSDTVATTDPAGVISAIHNRNYIRRVQTPQGFKTGIIKKAHEMYRRNGILEVTDDCMLVLNYELADIHTVEGSEENIKITYPEDISIAEMIYNKRP